MRPLEPLRRAAAEQTWKGDAGSMGNPLEGASHSSEPSNVSIHASRG